MKRISPFAAGLLGGMLLMAGIHSLSAADRERIIARERDGNVDVQLQDLFPDKKYKLGMFEVEKNSLIESYSVDQADGGSTVNLVATLPKTGIYQLRLSADGQWLSNEGPPSVTIPKEGFRVTEAEIDRRAKKISLTLPASCIFRVVATNESQMSILTLQTWKFGAAGQKVDVPWDFWDRGKVKNYFSNPSLVVLADYIPLPEGFLITGNPDFASYGKIPQFANLKLPVEDFKFDVSLQKGSDGKRAKPEEREGLPVMRQGDIVKVVTSQSSLLVLSGRRFEILYFVNGDFVHEETEGMSPSNYSLPDLRRPSGRCYLTVNIRDFEGNAGSSTVAFWHDAPKAKKLPE